MNWLGRGVTSLVLVQQLCYGIENSLGAIAPSLIGK